MRKKIKGRREGLKGVRVSSINYDSASGKSCGSNRERGVIVFQ